MDRPSGNLRKKKLLRGDYIREGGEEKEEVKVEV
jgi:hypothetical protein